MAPPYRIENHRGKILRPVDLISLPKRLNQVHQRLLRQQVTERRRVGRLLLLRHLLRPSPVKVLEIPTRHLDVTYKKSAFPKDPPFTGAKSRGPHAGGG